MFSPEILKRIKRTKQLRAVESDHARVEDKVRISLRQIRAGNAVAVPDDEDGDEAADQSATPKQVADRKREQTEIKSHGLKLYPFKKTAAQCGSDSFRARNR